VLCWIKNKNNVTKSNFFLATIALGTVLLTLCGCDSFSLVSSPIQDRGVSGFFKDNILHLKIAKTLGAQEGPHQVESLVHQGTVLLVGVVAKEEAKQKAQRLVQNIPEVRKVINHVQVGHQGVSAYSNDVWISQKLKGTLFFDTRISSQNYHICVVAKVVYILGTARSQEELKAVIEHAESFAVRQVISYVEILK
jgi:osmotically-inducible protein OsmY